MIGKLYKVSRLTDSHTSAQALECCRKENLVPSWP